jgi:PAS domain S-box-containing protein
VSVEDLPFAQLAQGAAVLVGVASAICVAAARSGRWAAAAATLASGALLVGGGLGLSGYADDGLAARIVLGGGLGLAAAFVLAVGEGRAKERARRAAVLECETNRREVERLAGANVRLEDELRDVRRARPAPDKSEGETDTQRIARDMAEVRRRKSVEAAQSSERRHRAVFEGALEGMALLERETLRLVNVNPSLVRMTGYDAATLGQKSLVDLFVAGPHQPGKADLLRSAREGRPLAVELLRADGGVAYADVSVTVIGAGAEAQLLTVVRDMSERRLLEQELQLHLSALKERERRLEDANRELGERAVAIEEMNVRLQRIQSQKDQFVQTVSHELRTPMTSIRSFSEILLKHGDSDEVVRREFLEIINKESERLTRLVNNLLDLARIESGEARLDVAEFDVRDVVADAVASVSGPAAERRATVRRVAGDEQRTIWGDRDKIHQLVANLLANAVKFGPEGDEVLVEVKDAETPGRVEIVVTDHGPGIPAGELESVFERFRRGRDAQGVPGTGLGLAICREIAKLHGGRVWAESELGKGSRFRVVLPGEDESRRFLRVDAPASVVLESVAPFEDAAPSAPPADDARWSTTGSLPPLAGAEQRPEEEPAASLAGLPPIR